MKTKAGKTLALVALVGGFILIGRANTDTDVAMAQGRKAVVITRIFTGPDGLAHAEDIELKLNARGVSDMLKATGAEFSVRSPTAGAKPGSTAAAAATDPGWHTGPARQFVITLSGTLEFVTPDGEKFIVRPGDVLAARKPNYLRLPGGGRRREVSEDLRRLDRLC